MKKIFLTLLFSFIASISFAQQSLISYEDIKYLLHNNLNKADTFLVAKGYTLKDNKPNAKTKKYTLSQPQNTQNNIEMRSDGKKIFISLQTNVLEQYNLLLNSISQYKTTNSNMGDVQVYQVKDLGTIYITVNDSAPYDPLKKDYDIQIVPDKNVTAIN
jgi:dihydroorotate dehydrogenase